MILILRTQSAPRQLDQSHFDGDVFEAFLFNQIDKCSALLAASTLCAPIWLSVRHTHHF